ncbi:hypothetical protein ACFL9S_01030 [Erwinia sp. AnSW2-5]|uniref:hypothetical protein n=1 Tax=Erwinia sp. AnSW2-5 TaxID=3367692 RepID=UPI00385AC4B0
MTKRFFLLTVLLLSSFDGICNSLTFKRVGAGGYMIYGKVNANMLEERKGHSWGDFYLTVHESGNSYYSYTLNGEYCPDNAIGAANFINNKLSNGIYASKRAVFADNRPNWTADVFCSFTPDKIWLISTNVPSPPGSAECAITYPANVSFGNVILGDVKDINSEIKISCNASADVKVSLSKDTVKLGDAEVNYYFPDNKKNHSVSVDVNRPANFNVRFALEKTGNSLGYKTGDAVIIFSWQ